MKKGVLVLSSVLAVASIYIAYTQASLDVYKVKVDTMRVGNIKISLDLTGEVRPQNQSDIIAQNATVSDVYVKEGDMVDAGAPLFRYDTTDAQKQLDDAKKELQELQAKQAKAQSVYQTSDSSLSQYAQNAVSLAQSSGYELYHYNNEITNFMAKAVSDRLLASVDGGLESLIQSYLPQIQGALSSGAALPQDTETGGLASIDKNATLEEQVQTAMENVDALEEKIAAMEVTSAIGGKVLEVGVKKGETVAASSTAMVVADTGNMEVHSMVSGNDVKLLKTGMEAVLISSDGETKYPGVIARIGQKIASGSEGGENMTDLVIAPNAELEELPGSTIDLEVVLSQKKNVPVISLDCLTADGNVFVVDGNSIAHARAIQKGMQDDYNVQVTGGLSAGERLIVNPDKGLKDGQKVTVID